MRAVLVIVGIALLAAGLWALFGHGSYQTTDTVLQVGSAKLTATHDRAIPQWLGIAGVVVGALTAAAGLFKR